MTPATGLMTMSVTVNQPALGIVVIVVLRTQSVAMAPAIPEKPAIIALVTAGHARLKTFALAIQALAAVAPPLMLAIGQMMTIATAVVLANGMTVIAMWAPNAVMTPVIPVRPATPAQLIAESA
jgi:hypothetical protein